MSQRQDLIKKIQGLLAKTAENGCTEAEAVAATELVAKLMEAHDLTYTDVKKEVGEEGLKVDGHTYGRRGPSGRVQFPAAWHCMEDIAAFFSCKTWYDGTEILFYGTEGDAGSAHAELAMLVAVIERETIAHLLRTAGNGEHPRTRRASYEDGITKGVSERLRDLLKARTENDKTAHEALVTEPTAAGSGPNFYTPVVVAKQMIVNEKFKELGLKLTTRSTYRSAGSHNSYQAGRAAAYRISLGARRGLLK